jgi:hypothetical protein
VAGQRALAHRGQSLRERLLAVCETLAPAARGAGYTGGSGYAGGSGHGVNGA